MTSATLTRNTIGCLTCSGTGIDPDFGDDCSNCNGTGRKQTAGVRTVETRTNTASNKQLAFISKLITELGEIGDEAVIEAFTTLASQGHDTRSASKLIDQLLTVIKSIRASQRQAARSAAAPAKVEEGFYVIGEFLSEVQVVKVQKARGKDHVYGKVLDTETGRFEYTPGILPKVAKLGRKLTLEEAKHLGHLYGRCCVCGATLTDEDSIKAGIGPICASKF